MVLLKYAPVLVAFGTFGGGEWKLPAVVSLDLSLIAAVE